MDNNYTIREEKVTYVCGYELDGTPELMTRKRYVVYDGGVVATYCDSDFNQCPAIFTSLEQAQLFKKGKIGVLEVKYIG